METIPVAEIDLTVPLKVVGQKRSDKYLNMQSGGEKKKTKKKLKKRKHKTISSSDDEDNDTNTGPTLIVNQTFELPEGAKMSDDSDGGQMNLDDPHRALDIDLELYVVVQLFILRYLSLSLFHLFVVFFFCRPPLETVVLQKNETKKEKKKEKVKKEVGFCVFF